VQLQTALDRKDRWSKHNTRNGANEALGHEIAMASITVLLIGVAVTAAYSATLSVLPLRLV